MEKPEQDLANDFIRKNDVVLELGARYGSVSCTINNILNNKHNQVVVEPDDRVWNALEDNRHRNNCDFHIVKGFISNKNLDLTNMDDWYGGMEQLLLKMMIQKYHLTRWMKSKTNINYVLMF